MKKEDEIESSYLPTLTPPKAPSSSSAANYSTSLESTTAMTNEYNASTPTATPTLMVPSSHPIDLVPSHIPTHNVTTKTSAGPSLLPSVAPSPLNTTFEPTIEKVDRPSLRPSTSPSLSAQSGLAVTMTSPTSTTLVSSKPTLRNEPEISSLDSDLVFSSGNSEEDLLNINDGDSEPNAGVGIGFGLLLVAPLVILVVGIICEIKRRKRRRKRKKKEILPLRNTPIPKDHVMAHTRQDAMSIRDIQIIRSVPATYVAGKEAEAESRKAASRLGVSESLKRFKDKSAVQEMRNVTGAAKDTNKTANRVSMFESVKRDISNTDTSAPNMSRTSVSDAKMTQTAASRVGVSESLKRFKDTSAVKEMRNVTGDAKKTQKAASNVGISKSLTKRETNTKVASAPIMSRTSASDAKETQKAASRAGICESLKKEKSTNDTSVVQEIKDVTGNGDTPFQNTQIAASALTMSKERTTSKESGAIEKKNAATDSGVASSKNEATTVVAATFPGDVSVSSSISTKSSGSIQSMTRYAIKTKNLGAKETKESTADPATGTQKDHATRQLTKIAPNTNEETVIAETSAGGESRPKSEISAKDASAEKVTRKEYTLDTGTLDEISVRSSSSTQSSESVQSMTRFTTKSTKSVTETKAKKEVGDKVVDTKVENSKNSARIVKKDDAANFFEMLSTLQQFFDCNVDISSQNSPRTPS